MRLVTAALALLPALSFAGPFRPAVEGASQTLDQALALARRSSAVCRAAMKANVDRAIDDVDGLLQERGGRRLPEVREQVNALAVASPRAACPDQLTRTLIRAVEQLDEARGGGNDGRVQRVSTPVEFNQLRLNPQTIHDTENMAQVDVPEVRFHQQRGLNFRLGARVRAANGQYGEWQVQPMYSVPQDEYVWQNAGTFFIRHSTLRGIDTAGGHFVVRVSVLNEANEELGAVDQPLDLNVSGTPPPPPPGVPTGPHARPTPVVVQQQRDCGTGQDPGCNVTRNGVWAMDKGSFQGLMASMQATPSELSKEQMVTALLRSNGITAMQLGLVLDQFKSELSKLSISRQAAPRLTNPGDAIGLSVKFRSSLNQTEFVTLMSSQR